jgi:hypothetical protein
MQRFTLRAAQRALGGQLRGASGQQWLAGDTAAWKVLVAGHTEFATGAPSFSLGYKGFTSSSASFASQPAEEPTSKEDRKEVEREEEVKPDSAFKGQSVGPKGVGFRVYPKPTKTEGQEVKGADKDEVRPNAEHTKKQQEGYLLMYPRYEKEYVESVKPRHKPPEQFHEKTGLWAVTAMRWSFDKITGYPHNMNEEKWLQRIVFLETVAGVPGMSGAMLRHLGSLRTMKRDNGWIHTLLEEAENERMHLLTFMQLRHPGALFRAFVLLTQGVFFNLYTFFYLLSPKHCHAFVGYLEEEAVKTYTHCLKDIDQGKLPGWEKKSPPEFAKDYWGLDQKTATMRDLVLAVRADEHSHSHVNHAFSKMKPSDVNPFEKGSHTVP